MLGICRRGGAAVRHIRIAKQHRVARCVALADDKKQQQSWARRKDAADCGGGSIGVPDGGRGYRYLPLEASRRPAPDCATPGCRHLGTPRVGDHATPGGGRLGNPLLGLRTLRASGPPPGRGCRGNRMDANSRSSATPAWARALRRVGRAGGICLPREDWGNIFGLHGFQRWGLPPLGSAPPCHSVQLGTARPAPGTVHTEPSRSSCCSFSQHGRDVANSQHPRDCGAVHGANPRSSSVSP